MFEAIGSAPDFTQSYTQLDDGYTRTINQAYETLTADQELLCIAAVQTGTPEQARIATDRIVASQMRSMAKLSRRMATPIHTASDLMAVAAIALIEAAKKFDATASVRLWSYAKWSMINAIQEQTMENSTAVRVPRNVYKEDNKEDKTGKRKYGGKRSRTGMWASASRAHLPGGVVSLNEPVSGESEATYLDQLMSEEPSVLDVLSDRDAVQIAISAITGKGELQTIIRAAYGLDHGVPASNKDIAVSMNMSVSQVIDRIAEAKHLMRLALQPKSIHAGV